MKRPTMGGLKKSQRMLVALACGLVMVPSLAAQSGAVPSEDDPGPVAREIVASRNGAATKDFVVLARSKAEYPLSGRSVHVLKLEDRRTGDLHVVFVEKGREVDQSQLQAAEDTAYRARYGRFDPALAELLPRLGDEERVRVAIWLKEPPYDELTRPDPGSRMTQEDVDAFFQAADAHRAAFVDRVTQVPRQRLADLGERAASDPLVAMLAGEFRVSAIRRASAWPETDLVYLDPTPQDTLSTARSAIRATQVHSLGYTGTGVRTAQVEMHGRIATTNPYLSGITQDTVGVCPDPHAHSTAVAGIIHSSHSTYKGIAPGSLHWAGGGCNGAGGADHLQKRSTAAADWGARVINISFKADLVATPVLTLNSVDRFYDDLAINRMRTVVVSAGNEAGTCESQTGRVTSPGKAFNVLTVGMFDDKGYPTWTGDTMHPCSGYLGPSALHNAGRQKPEVVAPGRSIRTTTLSSPWVGNVGDGSSYATPMVTGAAALMIDREAVLGTWPEANRAILMATAFNNIDGESLPGARAGAGGIDAERASNAVARLSGSGWGAIPYSCSSSGTMTLSSPFMGSGRQTRVAIAWNNDPAYTNWATRPSVDIDLFVTDSKGNEVARSTSYDDNYEILDFKTGTAGTYHIVAKRYGCEYSPRALGWAWYNRT